LRARNLCELRTNQNNKQIKTTRQINEWRTTNISANQRDANFESVSKSFGTPDGPSYQSGMSDYNGSGYGTDRAVMNQKIPVTTDMQALGELTDGGIPTTSLPETIVWAEFGASSLTDTSIDVATGFVKTGIMNYYRDQIGSVRMVTKYDTADNVITTVWKGDYTPYGEILTEDYGMNWLPLKTFALHEYDRETGLYYAQARWYDPETSQFVSEDGAQDGLNWYGYCGGDPLGAVDPSGLYGTTGDYGKDHMNGTWGTYNPITYGSGSGSGGGGSGNPAIPTVTPKEMTFKEWCDYSWQMTLRHGYDHNSGRSAYERDIGKDDYYYQEWSSEIAKETLSQNILADLYMKNPVNTGLISNGSFTFMTSGTIFGDEPSPQKYFLDSKNNPDSIQAAKELGVLLGGIGQFIGWSGKNGDTERGKAAENIYEIITRNTNIQLDTVINLVGHSHGSNVMMMVANMLEAAGYKNINLITLESPVREYQLAKGKNSIVNHIQLYSNNDWVQVFGGKFSIQNFTWSLGTHQFSNVNNRVNNIDTTNLVNYFLQNTVTYQQILKSSGNFSPCPYHQMSRSVIFIKEALGL
jgi:RHS repeat-associated protein